MKKIIWIIIIILLIAAAGSGTYWFFDKEQRGPDGGSLSIGDFFPFGQGVDLPTDTTTIEPPQFPTDNSVQAPLPRLWKIYNGHQAGAGLFEREGESFVRFVDTATGNVFENKIGDFELKRISNTTIPKIKEALWLGTGDSLIVRYTSGSGTIQTLHAKISPPEAIADTPSTENGGSVAADADENLQKLAGTLLPANIVNLGIFSPKNKIFFLVKNSGGGSTGHNASADGSASTKVFESPISEWVVSWPKENTVVMTTKPSAFSAGYSYSVNPTTGSQQRLIGNIAGLSVNPSSDVKQIAYSESVGGNGSGFSLKLFDVTAGNTTTLAKTLAEKCLWQKDNVKMICAVPKSTPRGTYPDNWYDGSVSFSDDIWTIDTKTGQLNKIVSVKETGGEDIDVINPKLNNQENILVFTNKKDSTLWGFRLND